MNAGTKVPIASVAVKTESYAFAHGRKPRGRGWWWFGFGGGVTYREFQAFGLYSEARRKAQTFAASCGCREVTVLP